MINTILQLDDDWQYHEMVRGLLKPAGIKVVAFTEATQALEWLENNLPAVIVTDLHMPRMDGERFIAAVRKIEHLKLVPLILFSNDPHLAKIVRRIDVTGISKMDHSILRQTITNFVTQRAAWAAITQCRNAIDAERRLYGKEILSDEHWKRIAQKLVEYDSNFGDAIDMLDALQKILADDKEIR